MNQIVCNATVNKEISPVRIWQFRNDHQSLYTVCVHSNLSEESKQQNSELSEQLKLSTQKNGAMRLELEDLHKRLEIADLMLQQVG